MTNLRDMSQRRDAWLNEKPQGGGEKLRGLRNGDEVFFWFAGNGDEGDRLIKIYRAHAVQTVVNGQPMTATRYCPKQNDGEPCALCDQGLSDMKERMGIWMYITSILHATLAPNTPPDKIPPQINYQGTIYFNDQINGFKFWDASAWRDSPWPDIIKLSEMHQGLHKFMAQMSVVGEKMQRRYKLYAMPNSTGLPTELYQQAMNELKPVKELLLSELASPVATAPGAPQQNLGTAQPMAPVQNFQPFSTPVNNQPHSVPPFNPFSAAPPAPQVPPAAAPTPPVTTQTQQAPVVTAEQPQPQVQTPAPPQATEVAQGNPPQEAEVANSNPPWENIDPNKPLQSMF